MQANEASVSGKPDYVEADLLGLTEEGAIRAGADPAAFAALRIPNDPERSGPRFEGTLTEFEADCGGTEFAKELRISPSGMPAPERQALSAQLHNVVRKCGACGKSCGFTTTLCNGCGAELPQETVHTDNIFMSFIYGTAKVPCATLPRARRAPHQPRVCVHGCAGRALPVRHRGAAADEGAAGVRRPSRALSVPLLRDPDHVLVRRLAAAAARAQGGPRAADAARGGGVEVHGGAVPLERRLVRSTPARLDPAR